jgi:sugar phosphate isomerase/epimerase
VNFARAEDKVAEKKEPLWKVSLAEYSLHRMIEKKELDPRDLGTFSKKEFGITALDRWNRPMMDKANDDKYLAEIKKRDDAAGVVSLLIMIDGEGDLGNPDEAKRKQAVENHHKWVAAAKDLGCHSIRVNARSDDKLPYEEQLKLAADGLRQLSEFGAKHECNVIVENHGGLSSNGAWLAGVMKAVDLPNCGTLPDFGNFGSYDRYKGVEETMPWAKSVSAKSHDFDAEGNETRTDYFKMMKIVIDAGYDGYVGIEYEGGKLSEVEGVKATQKLLARAMEKLSG